jgi:molybdopterin-guanine dinucleotide biosynthesis protein B
VGGAKAGGALKLLGLTGWSGSGKTTLLVALVRLFIARGLSVSTVKHAHHGFDLDRPGKDSWRHREAGAAEVLICSGARWALLHELHGDEPRLADLLARLAPVDLVLVEGFKANPHPKIEVHRPALARPPLWPGRADIVAVAADAALPGCDRPVLPLNEPASVADWALAFLHRDGAVDRNA